MRRTSSKLKQIKNSAWEEKYRPKYFRQVILPAKVRNAIEGYLKDDIIPNLILHSSTPGTGKTTTGIALANTLGAELKFVKASEEASKELVRTDINQFCATMSIEGKPKIVLLDEADGKGGLAFQEAMKGAIESNSHTTKFIFTCNNYENILDPLKSRCISIKFDQGDKAEMYPMILERLKIIADTETKAVGGTYSEDTLKQLIANSYPDMRDMIKNMQFIFQANGGSIIGDLNESNNEIADVIADLIIAGDFNACRKQFRENVRDVQGFIYDLGMSLYEKTSPKYHLLIGTKLADAARWDTMSVNPDVNVAWGAFAPLIKEMRAMK